MNSKRRKKEIRVMAFGVGAYTQGMLQTLRDDGAQVFTYLTRPYGRYAASLVGPTFPFEQHPDPTPLLKELGIDFVVPQSIDWAQKPWRDAFLASGVPIFCPVGEGLKLERERDFARQLCERFKIPFPRSYVARNRLEAEQILQTDPRPYVFKNPLCSPASPIHTIVCETVEDTRSWMRRLDYAEGVFFQEYMGRAEAGHIAFVSGGEIYSVVTNQEYKRAYDGNQGIVAGAPLGGLVERDPHDKYHLARELLHPLLPWFREVNFHGPVQVTAAKHRGTWHVLEYNVRIGVTSGPMILRLLENPLETVRKVCRNEKLSPHFRTGLKFGCSLTLAGFGYPYTQIAGPKLPIETSGKFDCDVWWNEVATDANQHLHVTGHRLCDVAAIAPTLPQAIRKAYANIRKIRCLASYYRTDVGQSLWPPGNV